MPTDDEGEIPDRKPTLENFLAGVPLNEEMEQLARDVMEEGEPEAATAIAAPTDPFDPLRELDDADRKALQKLIQEPGWEVLCRMRKRACADAEKAATLVSQQDPLGNAEKIARGWAYMALWRQIIESEGGMIQAELEKIKPRRKKRSE
jgi:hypothetical protein